MPHILVACGFIVLPRRNAVACVDGFHRECDLARGGVNTRGVVNRQIENVLEMFVRRDDDVAVIAVPLVRADERGDRRIALNDVALE